MGKDAHVQKVPIIIISLQINIHLVIKSLSDISRIFPAVRMKHFDDLARSHQQARASTKRASAVLCTVINFLMLVHFLPEELQDFFYFNRSELVSTLTRLLYDKICYRKVKRGKRFPKSAGGEDYRAKRWLSEKRMHDKAGNILYIKKRGAALF